MCPSLVGVAPAYLADDSNLPPDVGRLPVQPNSNDMQSFSAAVLDCGTIFQPDYSSGDCASTPLDNL